MKRKRKRDGKGAITLFLTIVLVPCIVFACAFGDVSRVQLSKSQSDSAADLAMYSLMANYDKDLKEWYGLVASCQTIDQFYAVTEEYFTGMLDSHGVDGLGSDLFISYLHNLRNGGDLTDFLQCEFVEPAKVSAAPDGLLGSNPALIEQGIVEFMKYRGPVEIVKNLIDNFKNRNILKSLTDADKDKPITEARQQVSKTEGEMLEEMLYTYLALETYQSNYKKNPKLTIEEFQNTYPDRLSKIREDFKEITRLITNYYAFQGQLQDLTKAIPNYDAMPKRTSDTQTTLAFDGSIYSMEGIGAVKSSDDPNKYTIDAEAINKILRNKNNYLSELRNAAGEITTETQSLPSPEGNQDVNPVIFCIKVENALAGNGPRISTVKKDAQYLMEMYCKLLLAETCELPEAAPGQQPWKDIIANTKKEIETIHSQYLSYGDGTTNYEKLVRAYAARAYNEKKALEDGTYPFTCQAEIGNLQVGASTTIGQYLLNVRNVFETLSKDVQTQIDTLNTIINGGKIKWTNGKEYDVVSLDDLYKKVKEYNRDRELWGDSSEGVDTDYAKKEHAEYEHPDATQDSELAAAMKKISEEEVRQLKTRLTNIKKDLETFQNSLKAFTYGGVPIYNMSGKAACIQAGLTKISTSVDSVNIMMSQNGTLITNYYNSLISPLSGPIYTAPTLNPAVDGNNPDLTKEPPEIYLLMKENINPGDLDNINKAKDEHEKAMDDASNRADEKRKLAIKYDENYLLDVGDTAPGGAHGDNPLDAGTILTSAVSAVTKIVGGDFSSFRDQLYVVEYCMDMFSYSDFHNEGQYKMARDKKYTLDDFKNKCFPDEKDEWMKEDAKVRYENQSLTNRPINAKYNASNLSEIEYILYGKPTIAENLEASYGDLYKIRLALNAVAGFQVFYPLGASESADLLDAFAASIQVATCGIVPIPLTKCLTIGIISVLESANDVLRLKAGIPVTLYKAEEKRWLIHFSLEGLAALGAEGKDTLQPDDSDVGLFYSDYMYIFMCIAANSPDTYKSMLLRIGDLIENNMQKGGKNGFDLDKSICFFQMQAKVKVKPLFLTLPIVSSMENVDVGVVNERTDWCTYKVSVVRGYS